MDVYLDAVFFPNCVRDPRTFAQEGWHYELEQPEVPIASATGELQSRFSSAAQIRACNTQLR